MFDFRADAEEEPLPRSRRGWVRLGAYSGAFLVVMVTATLAATVVAGFVLFWVVRTIQD